jgi:hypothetical protein
MDTSHRASRRSRATVLGIVALTLAGAALAQDAVPLPLKLPKPNFIGTPGDLAENPHLEKPLGKARPVPTVPAGTVNLSLKKPVTSSNPPYSGTLAQLTDGNKDAASGTTVELKPRLQWVQVDLGAASELSYILIWHFHEQPVVFRDVIVQVSNDAEFKTGVTTLFNNDYDDTAKADKVEGKTPNILALETGKNLEYVETNEGKLIPANKTKARYVRFYSRGSTFTDPLNRYTEVEVYGLPAK